MTFKIDKIKEPENGYIIRDGKMIHKSKTCLDYPLKKFKAGSIAELKKSDN